MKDLGAATQDASEQGSKMLDELLGLKSLTSILKEIGAGIRGESYHRLDFVESDTNHNYEEIVETIDTYNVTFNKEK